MFSALKRLVSNQNEGQPKPSVEVSNRSPHGVSPMDQLLQRKFAKGVQYNMKIIIKGDRKVGKSCLFLRLQGQKFVEEYVASDEIQVASIQWNYKATDDIVKVEIWDVVDKGKKKKKIEGLKLDNKSVVIPEEEQPALDAEFVDVYKGTNGVIIMLDMTKQWTFDYVQREIVKVPQHIPILVLANHRDMGHHRVITEDQVRTFIESLDRSEDAGQIRYSEASMRNGFGLKFLHKFFNLPFLHLQRETLLRQLETNFFEIQTTCHELDTIQESDDQNYDQFLDLITNRRRQIADQLSKTPNGETNGSVSAPPRSMSMPANLAQKHQMNAAISNNEIIKPSPSIIIGANNPLPAKFSVNSRNSSNSNLNNVQSVITQNSSSANKSNTTPVKSVDEFVPEDEKSSFKMFLEEPVEELNGVDDGKYANHGSDSDTDTGVNNPMVAKYQEELDPEDQVTISSNDFETITPYLNSSEVPVIVNNENNESENELEKTLTPKPIVSNVSFPINTLNSDDLSALENIYKSANSRNTSISAPSSSSLTTATTTSADNSEIGSESGSVSTKSHNKSQNKHKSKTKKKSKKKKQNLDNYDSGDEDARRLEEFLGTDKSSRDAKSYELL